MSRPSGTRIPTSLRPRRRRCDPGLQSPADSIAVELGSHDDVHPTPKFRYRNAALTDNERSNRTALHLASECNCIGLQIRWRASAFGKGGRRESTHSSPSTLRKAGVLHRKSRRLTLQFQRRCVEAPRCSKLSRELLSAGNASNKTGDHSGPP